MSAAYVHALPAGSVVGDYRIRETLGAGGFGITYRAERADIGLVVALKEYYPRGVVQREAGAATLVAVGREEAREFAEGLARFLEEARTLAALKHDNVARIHDFFRANGTAYLAMEHVEGETLAARIERGGAMDEARIRAFLPGLLAGLKAVHAAGFLHRDLKPQNVMLRAGTGRPVLIDFGAARASVSGSFRSLTAIYSPGYTAPEQYGIGGAQGPWSDIYSLGATLYACLDGAPPPDAMARLQAIHAERADPFVPARRRWGGKFSPPLLAAIDHALELKESARPRSVAQFEQNFAATRVEPPRPTAPPPPPPLYQPRPAAPVPPPRRSGGWRWLAALAIAGGIGYWGHTAGWFRPAPPPAGSVFRDCPSCPEMVVIPAGNFLMGSPPTEKDRFDNEGPQRRVTFARPFAMGKFEVTFEEWDVCVAEGGCSFRPRDDQFGNGRYPARGMSWHDAQAYAAWLSRKTGKRYRLPSEAEWEYAARAGSQTSFPWGEEASRKGEANCAFCLYDDNNRQPYRVGHFAPNKFGLHDMIGNVSEYVADCANTSYAGAPIDGSAWTEGRCNERIKRGGSYMSMPLFARSAYRGVLFNPHERPPQMIYRNGFRLTRDL